MAVPTVFVSSTFYDLRYVREGLKRFIESLGFNAVLSEEGTVFFNPAVNAAEACVAEVANVDMFVLLIGGRYGSLMPKSGESVTNAEYQSAIRARVPVFALVEQGTLNEFAVYNANIDKPDVLKELEFPNADGPQIFEFIAEVRSQAANNALVPFRAYADIEDYLRLQWAGMMHSFLRRDVEAAKVADDLNVIASINNRIELLAEQILHAVGKPVDRLNVEFLTKMLESKAVSDLKYIRLNPSPGDVLSNESLQDLARSLGKAFKVVDNPDFSISSSGEIEASEFGRAARDYTSLRDFMLGRLQDAGLELADFLTYEAELRNGGVEDKKS